MDGEMCGQKHSSATQTEGHHVKSHQHSQYFSSRTFHGKSGADNYSLFPHVCCDFEQSEFLILGVHYRQSKTGFFITKHNFWCALNGHPSVPLLKEVL